MTVRACANLCGFQIVVEGEWLDRPVRCGYVSDLMSDVLDKTAAGCIWITVQTHVNVVAVAAARELAAVVFTGGRQPEPMTVQKARQETVTLLVSELTSYQVVGQLWDLGIRGVVEGDEAL